MSQTGSRPQPHPGFSYGNCGLCRREMFERDNIMIAPHGIYCDTFCMQRAEMGHAAPGFNWPVLGALAAGILFWVLVSYGFVCWIGSRP